MKFNSIQEFFDEAEILIQALSADSAKTWLAEYRKAKSLGLFKQDLYRLRTALEYMNVMIAVEAGLCIKAKVELPPELKKCMAFFDATMRYLRQQKIVDAIHVNAVGKDNEKDKEKKVVPDKT